jgi:hypothetical protein
MYWCKPVLVLRIHVIAVVIDRGHPDRALRPHGRKRLVVDVNAMLDGVRARAYRIADARRTIGVDGDRPALRVRGIDDRFQLLVAERLSCVDRLVAPARGIDLDPVGTGLEARIDQCGHR